MSLKTFTNMYILLSDIIISFKHLCNIIMSLKTTDEGPQSFGSIIQSLKPSRNGICALTFPRNITDSGEVTSGLTRHLPPGPGTILVGGTKTLLGGTGMRHSTARGSVPVFRTSSQRGPFKYFEKVCVESHVTQERWGRSHL